MAGVALFLFAVACAVPVRADMPTGDPARGRELAWACDGCHSAAGVAPDETLANLAGQQT